MLQARLALGSLLLAVAPLAPAQHYKSDFAPAEFRARWNAVFDRIGAGSVAVVQGSGPVTGFQLPRQNNSFYYLSGIETPGAYLLLDGRDRRVTVYLPPRNERLERSEGRVLSADDADRVRELTGADVVQPTTEMGTAWPLGDARREIWAESAPAEGHADQRHELRDAHTAAAADPWDGGLPRHVRFTELLRQHNPRATLRDLTPVLDELRSVKSEREIALLRRAAQLSGLGLLAAMRSTKPRAWEYQLDAAARYEDTVVVTADGVENFTAFLPVELDALEAEVGRGGVLQALPALDDAGLEALRRQR